MPPLDAHNTDHSDAAASAPANEQDFDAAVAEFLDPSSDPAPAAADTDRGMQASGTAEEPAPAPEVAATPPAAGDGSPPAGSSTDDIWSTADPKLREAHEKELRDANLRMEGIRGRQSAADREAQRLRERIAELEAGQASGPPAPSQDQSQTSDRLQPVYEEFPDVAGPLVEEIRDLRSTVASLTQPVGDLQQAQAKAALEAQQTLLAEKHPDWREVASDDRFQGWVQAQPLAIREAMARNYQGIVDGEEAALVVGLYKSAMGIGASSLAPAPVPSAAPAATPDDRRQRQLAHGRDTGRTGPNVATGIPNDLDAAIDAFLT